MAAPPRRRTKERTCCFGGSSGDDAELEAAEARYAEADAARRELQLRVDELSSSLEAERRGRAEADRTVKAELLAARKEVVLLRRQFADAHRASPVAGDVSDPFAGGSASSFRLGGTPQQSSLILSQSTPSPDATVSPTTAPRFAAVLAWLESLEGSVRAAIDAEQAMDHVAVRHVAASEATMLQRTASSSAASTAFTACQLLLRSPSIEHENRAALIRYVSRLARLPEPPGSEPAPAASPPADVVNLSDMELGDDTAVLAAAVVRSNLSLRRVELASARLSDLGVGMLAVALAHTPRHCVSHVDVSDNPLVTYDGAMLLLNAFELAYPQRAPPHSFVSFDGNWRLWNTSPVNAEQMKCAAQRLRQRGVTVVLPDEPESA